MRQTEVLILIISTIIFGSVFSNAQTGQLPADLDKSFGNYGFATSASGITYERGYDIEPDVTGKSLYVNQLYSVAIFDLSGKVVAQNQLSQLGHYFVMAIALDSNNNVYLAVSDNSGHAAVLKLRSDLSLDTSFGVGGKVTLNFPGTSFSFANDIGVENDTVVVVGHTNNDPNISVDIPPVNESRLFIVRLNSSGVPLLGFGSGQGTLVERYGVAFGAESVAFQGANIVVGGRACRDTAQISCSASVSVYDQGGRRLSSFNRGNPFVSTNGGSQTRVGVQRTGNIVFLSNYGLNPMLGRLRPNGSIDSSFNGNSPLYSAFPNYFYWVKGFKIDAMDRIVTTGWWYNLGNIGGQVQPMVTRFDRNGMIDGSFISTLPQITPGVVTLNYDGNNRQFSDGIAVVNGNIYVCGWSNDASPTMPWVAKLNGN